MSESTNQKFDPVQEFITIRDAISRTLSKSLKIDTSENNPFPAVNMYSTENDLVVLTQAIAGVSASSLEVAVENGILSIAGEIEPIESELQLDYVMQEIPVGTFSRQIPLPHGVVADKAEASLKQGVLRIRLPKTK